VLKNKSLPADERQLLDALVAMATKYPKESSAGESGDPGVAWIFDWTLPPK
jgi:hypothetical protein